MQERSKPVLCKNFLLFQKIINLHSCRPREWKRCIWNGGHYTHEVQRLIYEKFTSYSYRKVLTRKNFTSLRSWRYCVGARLKFWRRSRVPKKGSGDEAVEIPVCVRCSICLEMSWRNLRQIVLIQFDCIYNFERLLVGNNWIKDERIICIGKSTWFGVIFGITTTGDTSKLLYVISRVVRRVKFDTILKYHEGYLCQMSCTNGIIRLYPQKVGNFHM